MKAGCPILAVCARVGLSFAAFIEGAALPSCSNKTCLQSAIASSFSTTSLLLCAKVALASMPNRPA